MYNAQQTEKEILEFWEKKRIFEKLKTKNSGRKKWSFIDGPITANNPMGVHHAWGRTYKDVFQRFKAMRGYEQRFQNGFDCQGLWVEREEEKELGLKDKKDIERFGVLEFVQACKRRVEKFSRIQKEQSIRLGQWMDWDNSYYTMDDENNEHNWHLIKLYFEKGMLYKGKDAVPWCPRCGTASSKHDIVTEGYKEVVHKALFMRFPVKGKEREYFLIFTTTPWTVPANTALAVNTELDYVQVDSDGIKYWIAASCVKEIKGEYRIVKKNKGKELVGMEYEMPYSNLEAQHEVKHKVVTWGLVSGEEGTGIVHIAPGCGAEDFVLGKKLGLQIISPLDDSGVYQNGFGELDGLFYAEVNKRVLNELEEKGFAYKINSYRHRYPHCWRCGSELVFRLVDEWYIKCTDEIREKLIAENKKIEWFPEYGKSRQEEWFKNMGDWLISRKRYWGLPLPIWECKCGNIEVIGSKRELRKKAVDAGKVDALPELHKPWIDEIKIKCGKCGKEAGRVPDVGDAWLDAGIVPFSTLHYLTDKKYWNEWFPADFISESIPGQCRGWFNAILWASVALTGKSPFKSLLGYETIKDEKGEEMHKSKGNAIWFDEAVEKTGADSMRLLYCLQDPAQELRFGYNALREISNSLLILYNLRNLIEESKKTEVKCAEDRWILSKCNSLIAKVSEEIDKLHPHQAARAIYNFWLNDLSRGYVQLIRERIAENDIAAQYVLKEIYIALLKLLAPIIPFLTEELWQELKKKDIVKEESVHLTDWPKAEQNLIDFNVEKDFELLKKIIELGLAERDKAKIGLRWPLAEATVTCSEKLSKEMQEIIMRQINVKKITLQKGKEISVLLNVVYSKELEAEGYSREFMRKIQSARREAGLKKEQPIALEIYADKELLDMLKIFEKQIKEKTNSRNVSFTEGKIPQDGIVFTVRERKICFLFRTLKEVLSRKDLNTPDN